MKTILTIALLAMSTLVLANGTPKTTKLSIIESSQVSAYGEQDVLALFSEAVFDESTGSIQFSTTEEVSLIQIINSLGGLDFQLPVGSDDIRISKELFYSGHYKLGFIVSGQPSVILVDVVIR